MSSDHTQLASLDTLLAMTSSGQRFSPVSSDFGDRALSPALSASSRTTTSFPTDMSDVSSLDGEDFEVIDAPRVERAMDDDDGLDGDLAESFDDLGQSSQQMSSAPTTALAEHHVGDRMTFSAMDEDQSGDVSPMRTSLTTLQMSQDSQPVTLNSTTSSLLRFPDPLDASFQQAVEETLQEASLEEREEPPLATPKTTDKTYESFATTQHSNLFAHQRQPSSSTIKPSSSHSELVQCAQSSTDHATTPGESLPPPGFPFKIDKSLLANRSAQLILSLVVMLIASGILPVWNPLTQSSKSGKSAMITIEYTPSMSTSPTIVDKSCLTIHKATKDSLKPSVPFDPHTVSVVTSFVQSRIKTLEGRISLAADRGKEVMVISNQTQDVAVYTKDLTLSTFDWISSTSSRIAAIDLAKYKDTASIQVSKHLHKPAYNAKAVTHVLKSWLESMASMHKLVQPLSLVLLNEASLLKEEWRKAWARAEPGAKEVLATLQIQWHEWMQDVIRIYTAFAVSLEREAHYAREELNKAWRTTNSNIRRLTKSVYSIATCENGPMEMSRKRSRHLATLKRRKEHRSRMMQDSLVHERPVSWRVAKQAKAGLYGLLIQTGQARLNLEDVVSRATCHNTGSPSSRRRKWTPKSHAKFRVPRGIKRSLRLASKKAKRLGSRRR